MMENHGVVGVFVGEEGEKTRCSIAVRAEQSRKELEEQVRREHSVNISLRKMYAFSCKGNVVDVETGLRKICTLVYGQYTQRNGWESYKVDDCDIFCTFIREVLIFSGNTPCVLRDDT